MKKNPTSFFRITALALLSFLLSNEYSLAQHEIVFVEIAETEIEEEIHEFSENGSTKEISFLKAKTDTKDSFSSTIFSNFEQKRKLFSVFQSQFQLNSKVVLSTPRYILFGSLIVYS